MKQNTTLKGFILLVQLAAIIIFMSAGVATAADAISLSASEPVTMYYTTNGATPATPTESYSLVSGQVPVESSEDKRKNKELKKKLRKKYELDNDALTIRLEHTEHGAKGRINLLFKRNSSEINDSVVNKDINHSRAKSIVKNFISEESELFGATDFNELIEVQYRIDELGFTIIELQRYVNQLPVENTSIRFFIRSSGEISSVSANLLPAPPELYEAAKKDTLPETRILEIAEDVLRGVGFDVTVNPYMRKYIKTQKVAISTPPYVLWKVESYWNLFINAFTGDVVEKHSNIMR